MRVAVWTGAIKGAKTRAVAWDRHFPYLWRDEGEFRWA